MDRFLAALYRRFKDHRYGFVAAALIWAYSITLAVVMITVGTGVLFLDFTGAEFLRITLVTEAVAIFGISAGVAASWSLLRGGLRWIAKAPDAPGPEEALKLFLELPRALPARALLLTSVLHLAITDVYVTHQVELPLSGFVAVVLAVQIACIVVWCLGAFGLEFLLRPAVEEAAAQIPMDAEVAPLVWRVRARILVPVPVIAALVGLITGGVAVEFGDSGSGQLLATAIAAILAAAAFTPLIKIALTDPLMRPIADLTAAAERVAAGDLSTAVPVTSGDELGALATAFNRMQVGLAEREALRSQIVELLEEVRASRARIVAASDEARRKVERDLHDGAQQHLVLLKLKLGLLDRIADADSEATKLAAELHRDLDRALDELRDLAHGIYPAVLTSDGLPGALAEAAEQAALPTSIDCDNAGRYPPELEAAVYFCCLEALQNVAKHAGEGATATVRLEQRDGGLRFEVADDGRGFDTRDAAESAGLQNMVDRIGALGGELRVDSRPGAGTKVAGTVPLGG